MTIFKILIHNYLYSTITISSKEYKDSPEPDSSTSSTSYFTLVGVAHNKGECVRTPT